MKKMRKYGGIEMGVFQIISGILLIIISIIIVVVVLLQESKQQDMSTITGGASDSYFNKNPGRTLEATLTKMTKYAAIGFFVITLAVNFFALWKK